MRRELVRFLGCGVTLALWVGVAFAGIAEDEDEMARRDAMQLIANAKARGQEQMRLAQLPPYPDFLVPDPKAHQGREWISDWKEGEMNRFGALLDRAEVDVLVVPCQVQASGIERANRSLMTALLAQALSSSVTVADPYLVSRALGDGERRFERAKVIQLAYQLRAKRILWCYAGHKYDNRLHLYFQLQERGALSAFNDSADIPGTLIDTLQFSDAVPPVNVFRDALPKIFETLGFKKASMPMAKGGEVKHVFPQSFAALGQPSGDSANDAFRMQFLASLAPLDAARLRERLFERSLLIAWQLPPDHQARRLLLARAYQGLRMRPSALDALSGAKTDEENALVAALNGNLPALDILRRKLPMSPQRVMAEIDAADIRFAYDADLPSDAKERAASLAQVPAPWNLLLARRLVDADPILLHRVNNIDTLIMLGKEFPAAGPDIGKRLRGQEIAGQSSYSDVDMALGAYLSPELAGPKERRFHNAEQWQLDRLDVLDFLVQTGTSNVIYTMRRLVEGQGSYREALSYLSSVEALFGSIPSIVKYQHISESRMAQRAEGVAKQALQRKANRSFELANYWNAGISHYDSDRPSHFDRPPYTRDVQEASRSQHLRENALAALVNATFHTEPLKASYHLSMDPNGKERLLEASSGRFIGSTVIPLMQVDTLWAQDKIDESIALLTAEVAKQPQLRRLYGVLGDLLVEEGRYRDAAEVFRKHPRLRGDSTSPLSTDNFAYEVGSDFYWRGESDLAMPFFKISVSQGTGSYAGMVSEARLAMLNGDYPTAARLEWQAARRYGNAYRFHDYFSLLHMLGESDAAWDGFNSIRGRLTTSGTWNSALTGLQRQGRSETQMIDWARQPAFLQQEGAPRVAGRFLAYAAVTDRIPSPKMSEVVNELIGGGETRPASESDFTLLYAKVKQKDFLGAEKYVAEVAKRYPLEKPEGTFFLPYYALAAGMNKHHKEVEAVLAKLPVEWHALDYWLARSVLAATSGAPEAADYFRKALAKRDISGQRLVGVEYQLADIAEILYESTGNAIFKDLAVQVARFNQRNQPWEAWSYAIEARWSVNGDQRKRALVKAMYLDRNSERLTHLPQNELDEAARIAKERNPFGGLKKAVAPNPRKTAA